MAGLGLENRNIPDSSITASSMNSATYRPSLGRLHHYYGWLAGTSNQQQWFQVGLRKLDQGDQSIYPRKTERSTMDYKVQAWL